MYSQGGWSYLTPNHDLYYEGELAILQTQLALEDSFMRLAETCTRPTFVVCDRGTLDISAYIDKQMWGELCEKCGTSANDLRNRYDAVLHLVSAADGAEQYYTTATNSTRYEQANEEGLRIARDLDKKVNRAWTGHPHLRVINNHDDFDAKLGRVIMEISNVLGLPQTVKEERVYLVEITGELPECIESEITQTYLVADRYWKRNARCRMPFMSRCYNRRTPIGLRFARRAAALSGKASILKSTPSTLPSITL